VVKVSLTEVKDGAARVKRNEFKQCEGRHPPRPNERRLRREAPSSLPFQPHFEFVCVEDVEDPLARDLCAHRDGRGVGIELEVGNGVRVGSEKDLAARIDGEAGEVGVEILAARETVDLDRHA